MAEIITAVVDNGIARGWDIPSSLAPGSKPRQEIVYFGFPTIPLKALNDISLFTLSCRLPTNFVYRMLQIEFFVEFLDTAAANDWSRGMRVTIGAGGITRRRFALSPQVFGAGVASEIFPIPPSPGNFGQAFNPDPSANLSEVIEANDPNSIAQIFVEWVDLSADITTAVQVSYQVRVLQFTIEQSLRYPINSPYPTLPL